ncbi:MAG: hypothetical protein GY870_14270 [archaeon]|nr:hypothetical protein [archaeon]
MSNRNKNNPPTAFRYSLPNSLKRCLNKTITVSVKIRGHFIRGVLKEFDSHLNLIMEEAEEIVRYRGIKRNIPLGNIIIRGDSIIFVDFEGQKEFIR